VKRGNVETHKKLMISAFCCSAVFLVSYLIHKGFVGTTHFREDLGAIRTAYLIILVSHFLLAILVPPLAITTIVLGFKGKIETHRRLAKWTFPIWIYVSITGVVVYLMLYQIWPPA
jgi:putative membrane protein